MVKRTKGAVQVGAVIAGHYGYGSLRGRGYHPFEVGRNVAVEAYPLESGGGEYGAVPFVFVQFAQPRVYIAANIGEAVLREFTQPLTAAPVAARSDDRLVAFIVEEISVFAGNEHIAGVVAFKNGNNSKTLRGEGRDVFEGMYGNINFTAEQGIVEGFGEDALASEHGEGRIEHLIAFGFDKHKFAFVAVLLKACSNMLGLPGSEDAVPGADADGFSPHCSDFVPDFVHVLNDAGHLFGTTLILFEMLDRMRHNFIDDALREVFDL